MRRFTRLYITLDQTNRTNEKLEALRNYFAEAPPEDASWAIYFLTGNRVPRAVNSPLLRRWIADAAELPDWLVEECYHTVGDLAETIALLLPNDPEPMDMPLHELVNNELLPLRKLPENDRREAVLRLWQSMARDQRFVWNKLITGSFRVGVSKTLVVKALSQIHDVEAAVMAHRLMGTWEPTATAFLGLAEPGSAAENPSRPYPFFLANPLPPEVMEQELPEAFQAEWKWDGIRCQLIRRQGQVILWSRGEDLLTDRFPEIRDAAATLPDGTVIDGEILAWEVDRPAPFQDLQKRITRKILSPKILAETPVAFMAYDLMEFSGEDLREQPLRKRRHLLEQAMTVLSNETVIHLSPLVTCATWTDLAAHREASRQNRTEGLMLKRIESPYRSGRVRGDWWTWKVDPYTMDAVLTYAQPGSGRRAGLYTDYTFGVWRGDELITVAKAYSGLTDKEIAEVDSWVRKNTTDKFGPVRMVKPELVFELAFEGIQPNTRNKSGLAVRFPRIQRWRKDKPASQADTLETLSELLQLHQK